MKKMPALILILLFMPIFSYAFQNEPDSFRGMKWGTSLKDLTDMSVATGQKEDHLYVKKNDKLQIGDADLTGIRYGFYKDQFYSVWIRFDSFSNFQKLKETLFQQYGTGEKTNPFMDNYYWFGANVLIYLDYNSIAKRGSIMYSYKPIMEEKKKDDKDKAKKASGDL